MNLEQHGGGVLILAAALATAVVNVWLFGPWC
jgi:hypothetical protein